MKVISLQVVGVPCYAVQCCGVLWSFEVFEVYSVVMWCCVVWCGVVWCVVVRCGA